MKALVNRTYGSPDILQYENVDPPPPPSDNEVQVQIHASSINSWDWDYLRGKPYLFRLLFGIFSPNHKILGADIAGKIVKIGQHVRDFNIGDLVYGDLSAYHWNGFTQLVNTTTKAIAKIPEGLSYENAASLPQAATLALQAIDQKPDLLPNQKVLINGAAGGVGTFAIQILKRKGVRIFAVDKPSKFDYLKSLGVYKCIDYTKEEYTNTGHPYDFIIDVIGQKYTPDYVNSLNKNGVFVLIGGKISTLLSVAFLGPFSGKKQYKKIKILAHQPNTKALDRLSEMVTLGSLIPKIDRIYHLKNGKDAFHYYGSGEVKGKIVFSHPAG